MVLSAPAMLLAPTLRMHWNAANVWHAWVSMKFDGPSYRGTAKEDLVLVERIILVKKSANQFQAK
jgi:hypothetical protein